jgi:hypothetical protein
MVVFELYLWCTFIVSILKMNECGSDGCSKNPIILSGVKISKQKSFKGFDLFASSNISCTDTLL